MQTSRRNFLKATSALSVAPAVVLGTAPKPASYVDAHSHIWSADVKRWPLAEGLTVKDLKPKSFTDKELLKLCTPLSVRRVVLIQHNVYHKFDNSYITHAIKQNPGTFSGVAVIDHTQGTAADVARRMVTLKAQGIRGFRILPRKDTPEKWLQREGMQTMWRTAGANGLAVCPLINPQFLPSVSAMCEKFPDTRVVIDHFARIGVDGQVRQADLNALCGLAKHTHTFVKISAYYALGKKKPPYTDLLPMIKRVLDAFGPERLMWGSDCPYQIRQEHSYEASLRLIRQGLDFVSKGDRDWLLTRTADKVFFTR